MVRPLVRAYFISDNLATADTDAAIVYARRSKKWTWCDNGCDTFPPKS